jgi:hypothetical protein
VSELVRVADRADGLDLSAKHVQRQRHGDLAHTVPEDRASLTIHLALFEGRVDPGEPGEDRCEQARDLVRAHDGAGQCRGLASGVAHQLDVRGEHVPQSLDIAVAERVEESGRQHVPCLAVHLEPWSSALDVVPSPQQQLATGDL